MTDSFRRHSGFAAAFSTAAANGELIYARCARCARTLGYRARVCTCGHRGVVWDRASGGARLLSYAVYHQAYGDDRPLPHTVAQVELDEGPRLVALLNADAGALQPGAALRLQLDPQGHLVAHRAEPSAEH